MKRFELLKSFIEYLNCKLFPTESVLTQLYNANKEVYYTKVKIPCNFITTVSEDNKQCVIYCFKCYLADDIVLKNKIFILEKLIGIPVTINRQHVVSQRRIVQEAVNRREIIIGEEW